MTARKDTASFPTCPSCGTSQIVSVSDGPICFSVGGGPARMIARSQHAQLLRFLFKMRPIKVVSDHLYIALGRCLQAARAIDTLRKMGIPIHCEKTPKAKKAGVYGLYWLGEEVSVWEPTDGPALVSGAA